MELKEAIVSRRSVRGYSADSIETDTIRELLSVAVWAPTACNRQDYFFIIVDDKELISRIVDAGSSKVLLKSDKVLFVLYSSVTDNIQYSDHVQSASGIIQNFLLLAHEQNIGTCWICHLARKKELAKLLNIPDGVEVIAAVSIGYPKKDNPRTVERKFEIGDVVGVNSFYSNNRKLRDKNKVYLKIVLNTIYYVLPTSLKKRINNFLDKRFVKKFEN
jgi:nitroreductase